MIRSRLRADAWPNVRASRVADFYALDSNIYVRALRDREQLAIVKRFLIRTCTRIRINGVVALELRAGARSTAQAEAVDALIKPYAERGRVVPASFDSFVEAGRVLSALSARERAGVADAPRSLWNDVLIATTCR